MSGEKDISPTIDTQGDKDTQTNISRRREVVFSLYPGTYAVGYVDPDHPCPSHWSDAVPYVVALICFMAIYFYS